MYTYRVLRVQDGELVLRFMRQTRETPAERKSYLSGSVDDL